MSIIDQARAEAVTQMADRQIERMGMLVCEQQRYIEGLIAGVRWLLDQLQDPTPETMATCVEAFRFHLVEWVPGEHAYDKPKYACVCGWSVDADCVDGALLAHRLRAAITALTNHLDGDPS